MQSKQATLKQDLKWFIRHPITDVVVMGLILISVALLVIECVFLNREEVLILADFFGDFVTLLFICELSIRYYVAEQKKQFLRSFWIDILAVLPIFRALRILRVLRLLRILRLGVLLNRRVSAVSQSFRESFGEVTLVLILLAAVVLLGALGVHFAERDNPHFHSLATSFWWSFLSLMAGEPVQGMPRSFLGRGLLVGVMLSGMTIFAILTGVVSAGMVHRLRTQMRDQKSEIAKQRNHVIICGVNRMLNKIIEELQYMPEYRRTGIVVVAEFEDPPPLSPRISNPASVYFLQGDYTKLNVLRDAGLAYARTAILLADKTKPRSDQDRDARTVLAAMLIERERKKIGGDIFTCVELLNPDNKEQLKALDVEEVVSLDDYGGSIIAASSANEGLVTVFNELFTRGWGNAFIKRPVYTDLIEKNVIEAIAWLKENKDALLLAVERSVDGRRKPIVNPDGDFRLQKGDALVLIATDENTK